MTKEEYKKLEMQSAKMHTQMIKESRKYFDYADLSQNILEQQKDEDLLLLGDWLTEVHNKLKPEDKRREEVFLLIKSLWRIEKYCGGLETICKASTVRVLYQMKRNDELESELKTAKYQNIQDKAKYDLEVKTLKSEIEWTSKNSKK